MDSTKISEPVDKIMQKDNEAATVDTGDCRAGNHEEVKTKCAPTDKVFNEEKLKSNSCDGETASAVLHLLSLLILGLCIWGVLWSAFGDSWAWDGEYFRLVLVAIVAWGSGLMLNQVSTLPPLLAALLTGILARYLGFLDMRHYTAIDEVLRKIYPIVILGKGSLAWDLYYMWANWRQVLTLGVLPWLTEVTVLAALTNILLGFPWIWGFMLGSVYASGSCPIVMPLVIQHGKLAGGKRNWPQFICTAGGIDTALSVGVFGVLFSFIFYPTNETYRYVKACLSLFAGVALGVSWGVLAGLLPRSRNYYVTELRILLVVLGALCGNFITSMYGWGGAGAEGLESEQQPGGDRLPRVLGGLRAGTFCLHWHVLCGWKENNPAVTAYRVFRAACEPALFAYTGTFFVIDSSIAETSLIPGFGILAICLAVRLSVVCLACWKLPLKEKLFVCCTWIPKSIVEAVLCPLALSAVISMKIEDDHMTKYAEDIVKLLVQAILITTPVGHLLTSLVGPMLLRSAAKDIEHTGN